MKKILFILLLFIASLANGQMLIDNGYITHPISSVVETSPLLDGLVAWYEFDEASGITAIDESANGFDGTIGSSLSINNTGLPSKAYSFTTASGNDVTIPDNDSFTFSDNLFSICFWINTSLSAVDYVINKYDNSTNNEFEVFIRTTGQIELRKYHNGTTSFLGGQTGTGTLSANSDHFIAVVSRGNYYGTISIYVDGVSKTVSNVGSLGDGISNTSSDVKIGIKAGNGWSNMELSQLIIYDKDISQTVIDSLYNSGSGKLFNTISQ